MKKPSERNEGAEQRERKSGPKGTKMRNKGNEEADRRGRERRLLETKKRTDGNKKADRCGLGSGPLKTGGGTGEGARDSWWGMMIATSCG